MRVRLSLMLSALAFSTLAGAASAQSCPAAARRQLVEAAEDLQSAALSAQDEHGRVEVLNVVAAGGALSCAGATVGTSSCVVAGPAVVQVKSPRQTRYFQIPSERRARITSGVPGTDPIRCSLVSQDPSGPAAR